MEEYRIIQPGEKIQSGDEYCSCQGTWRTAPDFLIGDIIPESSTTWRRTIEGKKPKTKFKWFSFFFRK